MPTLPDTPSSLVLRTDFSDDAAWDAVRLASTALSAEGYWAHLSFVDDRAFAGLTADEAVALPRASYRNSLFLVDDVTISGPEMLLLVVDLLHEPGRRFRVPPAQMWGVENNLSLANMDFYEFADNVDPDGVFRGFSD